MKQAHILITGFVQGVGYRKFVKHEARKMGLTGWVRNLSDGSVEALVVGEEKDIHKLIELCNKGPFLAQVDSVHAEWEDAPQEEFSEFVVRHE